MSHDRGAFGALLAEAMALGEVYISFNVDLEADAESSQRWIVCGSIGAEGEGRTGEEALRRYLEALRG